MVDDNRKLAIYLKTGGNEAFECLSENVDVKAWEKLNEMALVQIMLFNRRRQGEVSKTKVEDYMNLHSTNQEDTSIQLSPLEQKLCQTFKRIEIIGKKGRFVPVIITPQVKAWIDLLLPKRDDLVVENVMITCFQDVTMVLKATLEGVMHYERPAYHVVLSIQSF